MPHGIVNSTTVRRHVFWKWNISPNSTHLAQCVWTTKNNKNPKNQVQLHELTDCDWSDSNVSPVKHPAACNLHKKERNYKIEWWYINYQIKLIKQRIYKNMKFETRAAFWHFPCTCTRLHAHRAITVWKFWAVKLVEFCHGPARPGPVRICQFVHSIFRFFDDI